MRNKGEQEINSLIELKLSHRPRKFFTACSRKHLCNQRNANFVFNGSLWIMKWKRKSHTNKKWAQRDNEQDSSIEIEQKKHENFYFFGRLIKIHRYSNLSPL